MNPTDPLVVAPQRSVFAISTYVAQATLGVLHVCGVATPNSLIEATDIRIADAWSVLIIVAALFGIYGVLGSRRKPLDALSWESGGCMGLAVFNGLYVVNLYQYTHGHGVVQVLAILSILTVTFAVRFWQCQRDHSNLEHLLRVQIEDET